MNRCDFLLLLVSNLEGNKRKRTFDAGAKSVLEKIESIQLMHVGCFNAKSDRLPDDTGLAARTE
jgi:hypothetical protein